MSNAVIANANQLSFFDLLEDRSKAVNLRDGRKEKTSTPEPWMKRLIPGGELVITVGGHPMVLSPTPAKAEDIREELRYMHYTVGNTLYSGIFVGEEVA